MKKAIIIILSVLIVGGLFGYTYLNSRIVYNKEFTQGNTSGNLLNGGLFCEDGNKIYFSNPNDDGNLYVMNSDCTNFQKINDDKAAYINSAGKYLYYCRKNNEKQSTAGSIFVFSNVGVYRLDKKNGKLGKLYAKSAEMVNLSGNYIYYQHYTDPIGLELYQVKIDGREEKCLLNYPVVPSAIMNDTLYYTNTEDNHNLYSMNLRTTASDLVYEGNCTSSVIQDEYLYFLDMDRNYALTRTGLDGSDPVTLVNDRVFTYNISPSGKYIYYQVDDKENSRLSMLNTETGKASTIMEGNYNSIHITSNYVFFTDFSNGSVYVMPLGADSGLGIFDPPALS